MKFLLTGIVALSLLSACRVSERAIVGTYHPAGDQFTRLVIKEDKTFELALLSPATDTLLITGHSSQNSFTIGSWKYEKNRLVLTSDPTGSHTIAGSFDDSLTRFTNISSFNFWNRYGDPVPIRYIILPPSPGKPHFGNSLYYFSQDFKRTDTLKFYFDGYPPFNFPGSVPYAIGNNMHKVTLIEPYYPSFQILSLAVKKNTLITANTRKLKKNKQ
jgi:hypothetical protein